MKNAVNFKVSYSIKRNGVLECHNKTFSDILSAMEAVDKFVQQLIIYLSKLNNLLTFVGVRINLHVDFKNGNQFF
jgi:hypothetical protein